MFPLAAFRSFSRLLDSKISADEDTGWAQAACDYYGPRLMILLRPDNDFSAAGRSKDFAMVDSRPCSFDNTAIEVEILVFGATLENHGFSRDQKDSDSGNLFR